MIKGNKEFMRGQTNNPDLLKKINNYNSDKTILVMDVMTLASYKSRKQNSLFHGLLNCFWDSGCSSFEDVMELRDHYKKIAGLIYTREAKAGNVRIIEQIERSWADVKKDDATRAIKACMHDMDLSGVLGSDMGKKYEQILRGLGEWFQIER